MTTQAIDPALTRAYETCRRMHRRFDPTYYWATRRLPEEIRPATHALYGYVRTADQIVDGPRRDGRPEARRAALDAWEAELEAGLATGHSSQPVVGALVDAGRRHRLPLGELRLYMHSMRLDCAPVRIQTWDELVGYMEGSAGSVGRIMAPLLGVPEAHHAGFGTLGLAFQHANFIRDVREDRKLDRIYLTGAPASSAPPDRAPRARRLDRRRARPLDRAADAVRIARRRPGARQLADVSALVAGMEGADVCFHAAAKVEDFGPWKQYVQVNVEGTRNVLRACRAAGVGRAVHVCTEAALMHGQPLVRADESYPLALRSGAVLALEGARRAVVLEESRGALEAMIVRPRFVWGRGDTTLLPLLVEGTRSGAFRWVGGGRQRTSTTHVDNTVEGSWRRRARPRRPHLLRHRRRPGAVPRLRRRPDRHPGRHAADGQRPRAVARALAADGETAWKLLPLPGAPPLTRFASWVASQECTLDDTRARPSSATRPSSRASRACASCATPSSPPSAARAPTHSRRDSGTPRGRPAAQTAAAARAPALRPRRAVAPRAPCCALARSCSASAARTASSASGSKPFPAALRSISASSRV